MKKENPSGISVVFIIFLFAYLINLLWEVAHSLLYDWNQLPLRNDVYFYIPKILGCALGDAVIILIIFFVNCLFRNGFRWVFLIGKRDYMVFMFLGLLFAVGIEVRAIFLNLWSYSKYMPLVFGIGLTPLIQLSTTGVIVLFLTSRLYCSNLER